MISVFFTEYMIVVVAVSHERWEVSVWDSETRKQGRGAADSAG